MTTERINRIPESELPALPDGWVWDWDSTDTGDRCWDACGPGSSFVSIMNASDIYNEGGPPEVLALVMYANGIGPDPRATTQPTRDNRTLAIALLAAAMDDCEDARIEAAIALLENA